MDSISPASTHRIALPDWAPISALLVGWPSRPDTWRSAATPAQHAISIFLHQLLQHASEPLVLVVNANDSHARASAVAAVDAAVAKTSALPTRLRVLALPMDDCWIRDISPIFVRGASNSLTIPVCFQFNAWGGDHGGCYTTFSNDALFAARLSQCLQLTPEHVPIVLEGGSISVDGQGTLLSTTECLLCPNRNPSLEPMDIERVLKDRLGVKKVIWFPFGIPGDTDTDGHVDNIALFIRPSHILLAYPADSDDLTCPESDALRRSKAALRVLQTSTDAHGRPFIVHRVRYPPRIERSSEESEGVSYDPSVGSKPRLVGEMLAASYVNLVQTEQAVFMPAFGDAQHDEAARREVEAAFDGCGKKVISVQSHEFVLAGGGIHCLSAGIPNNVSVETMTDIQSKVKS